MLKPNVLFLCGENACRAQMAQGFLRDLAGNKFEVVSAGYEPAEAVCKDAIAWSRFSMKTSKDGKERWKSRKQ